MYQGGDDAAPERVPTGDSKPGSRWRRQLERGDPSPDAFESLLRDTRPAPDAKLPDTHLPIELRRVLSAPFIVGEHYGTRCSTVLTVGANGAVRVHEQHYAPGGAASEAYDEAFELDA